MVDETFKYWFPLDKAMVRAYARPVTTYHPRTELYAVGPFSSLEEIEQRLDSGIPLNSFEFQRIYRNLNLRANGLRAVASRYNNSGRDPSIYMDPVDYANLQRLEALEAKALELRPRQTGRQGGYSSATLEIRSVERRKLERARERAAKSTEQ